MVRRPEHGPEIDVVELTSASRAVLMIKHSSGIVTLKVAPIMGNSHVLAVGHQSKAAQNVSNRDDVGYLPQRRLIE